MTECIALRDALFKIATCRVCKYLFNSPLRLGCGHVFCFRCIYPLFTSAPTITCPECARIVECINSKYCAHTRRLVELIAKYFIANYRPENDQPEMTSTEIDAILMVLVRKSKFQMRFLIHRYDQNCKFPHKWVTEFAKRLGQSGHAFFLQKKLDNFLQRIYKCNESSNRVLMRCKEWPHCIEERCESIHPIESCSKGDSCEERGTCPNLHGEDLLHIYAYVTKDEQIIVPKKRELGEF